MNITRAAIEKNRITAVTLAIIIVGGLGAFANMSRDEDPGFIIRAAQVTTIFPGASPARVGRLVTDKLEKAIQEMPELDFITSESKSGVSVIMVNVKESYKEMRPIWDDLRRKVNRAAADLPDGVIGPTVNDEFGDVFGTLIALTGEGFTYAELKEVGDQARDELLLINDVAKVEIFGTQEERVFVEYNNARLAELGLSPIQLGMILDSRNIVLPGGQVTADGERIVLEPSGNFETVDDLRRTVISLPGRSDVVYLEDIATIERGYIDPPESKVTATGTEALVLAVSMRGGGNIISLGEQVEQTVDRLRAVYPIGLELDIVAFQPDEVDRKVNDFVKNLLQAITVVVVVMLLFLGLRTGLVVASLIPTAIIMAFLVMSFFGIGLDQVSLAALVIALGLLVDNAIVMVESTMVQMSEGKSAVQAAIDSASELRVPLLVSSLTTAAAFLPIFLAESSTGEYTAPLFKVVTITLLCSWILAITMVPLLAVSFVRVKKGNPTRQSFDTPFYRRYRSALLLALKRRYLTVAFAVAIFALAVMGLGLVPQIFFPPTDKAFFKAELELPLGTAIERTEGVVSGIESFLEEKLLVGPDRSDGVTSWAGFIGKGGPRFVLSYNPEPPSPNYAFMLVNTSAYEPIDEYIASIDSFAFANYPDLETTISRFQNGPPVEAPVQVRVLGRDPDLLFPMVDHLKERLRTTPGTRNVIDDWGRRTKKLNVTINQARARRAGVTNQDIALSLQAGLSGFELSEFREDDELIPITLRSVAADRQDIGKIESLNVFAQATGASVPLKQVADVAVAWEPAKILRRDRLRTVTVSAGLKSGHTAFDVIGQITPWLEAESAEWPVGYRWELGGEVETSGEANQSIAEKLPIAALIIILLLVYQFNSIRRPVIILLTIPLGLIGVSIGLIIARSYFGFMTFLGIIALAGIVINNAIVLIDRIKIEIEDNGHEPPRAIIEAAQRRLRPILLTTATTICGLIPLWLGGGPMWEPMAISIIFGLLFATLLTLGLVPVLYSLFFRISFRDLRPSVLTPER
ncbi:MAG: efflux RND transporter permease subunit [Gemmatimonadota bacterium]|nr:MAG: efflux RND transporter permease subunit [Gemmatimonadota bacterium]